MFSDIYVMVMADVTYVFPSQRRFAAFAIDIGDRMQAGEQDTLLGLAACNIHAVNNGGIV